VTPFATSQPTMGLNVSKTVVREDFRSDVDTSIQDRSNKICIDCQKEKKVDYPKKVDDSVNHVENDVDTDPCHELYKIVDTCMERNQGQISSCVNEWNLFNLCFTQEKQRKAT
jgi:hypothetical protein